MCDRKCLNICTGHETSKKIAAQKKKHMVGLLKLDVSPVSFTV